MQPNRSKLFKQRLFRGHIPLGITFSLLLYISIYFGLFAIFKPYIETWEKPSRHFPMADITQIDYAPMVATVLSDPDFPKDRIIIDLPGFRKDPALRISHQFTAKVIFNPITRQRITDEGNRTNLAMFINGMHYGRPLKKTGLVIFGFMAVAVMFLVVGGLLLLYHLPFKRSGKTPRGVFSTWHRTIFTWSFPLFTWIVLCASVMGLSFDGTGPLVYVTTMGEKSDIGPLIGPVLFPEDKPVEKANEAASMLPIRDLIKKAQHFNPRLHLQRLTLINWQDKTARIQIEGYNPFKPFLNGVTNRPAIVLNAHDGSLMKQTRVQDRPWSVLLTESVYFIHLLFGVGLLTRFLVFLIMLACGLGIGFGVLLWLEKRAAPFRGKAPFYHWMAKLSVSVFIGVIPATGILFILQWLLPFDLSDRLIWQQGAFFNGWLATLAWSFYRINSYTASKELLALGGVFFASTPILHFAGTGLGPIAMIQQDLVNILSVDAGLFLFGILLLLIVHILPKNRDEATRFWAPGNKMRLADGQ